MVASGLLRGPDHAEPPDGRAKDIPRTLKNREFESIVRLGEVPLSL
jgi:hypothetical protein